MTYPRDAATTESILTWVIQHLSPLEIEAATGKTLSAIQKAANPVMKVRLGFDDAAALDIACHARGLGRPFSDWWRVVANAPTALEADGFDRELMRTTARLGELANEHEQAIQDGHVDAQEAGRILDKSRQLMAAARRMHDRAAGMAAKRGLRVVNGAGE